MHSQSLVHIGGVATVRTGHAFNGLSGTSYQLSDHLGSVNYRLDENGKIIDAEEYYPFGDSSVRTWDNDHKRYRYTGKEKDAESGLYYYGARYYSAWTCRFISVDPLIEQTFYQSSFAYADNNPVMMNDPTGMISSNPLSQNEQVKSSSKSSIDNSSTSSNLNSESSDSTDSETNPPSTAGYNPPKITGTETEGDTYTDMDEQEYIFSCDKNKWIQTTFREYLVSLYVVRGTEDHGGPEEHAGHVIFYYGYKIYDSDGNKTSSWFSDRIDLHPGANQTYDKSKDDGDNKRERHESGVPDTPLNRYLKEHIPKLLPRYWNSVGYTSYDQPSVTEYVRDEASKGNNYYNYLFKINGTTYRKLELEVARMQSKNVHYGLLRKRCASYGSSILYNAGVINYGIYGSIRRRYNDFSPKLFKEFLDRKYGYTYRPEKSYTEGINGR